MRLTPAYIVGLVDGEGCFSVRFNKSQRKKAKVDMGLSVKLQAADRAILDRLRDYFGCGGGYIQKDRRPRHSLCYRYEVTAKEDLRKVIIPFFLNHSLQTVTKSRDYKLFSKILQLVLKKRHLTQQGSRTIARLKGKMH